LTWYSPEVGVATAGPGAQVLRTEDAGQTWESVLQPEELSVYALTRAGERTWLCGTSGYIYRSDDAGSTWEVLKAAPFNDQARCVAMSFLTPDSGWAVGSDGSVWATGNGGVSWKRLASPTPVNGLDHVLRVTAEVAWVQGDAGLFQTTDGGRTWRAHPVSPEADTGPLSVMLTPDGRRVVTRSPPGVPVEQRAPFLGDATVMGDDTVVALEDRTLTTFVAGQRVLKGPLMTPGSGVTRRLEGLARRTDTEWLGWVGEQMVATEDAGRSWYAVGRVPSTPVRALVFLKDGTALAELPGGALLRSENSGRDWKPGTDLMDAYDFTQVAGRRPGAAAVARASAPLRDTPFDCLLSSPSATLKVRFDIGGCYGSSRSWLALNLRPDGAEVSGVDAHRKEPVNVEPRMLPRAEGETLVRELIAAATRAETPLGCISTTYYSATLEWSCPSQPTASQVRFSAMGCGSMVRVDLVGGAMSTGRAAPDAYARALAIHRLAGAVLQGQAR